MIDFMFYYYKDGRSFSDFIALIASLYDNAIVFVSDISVFESPSIPLPPNFSVREYNRYEKIKVIHFEDVFEISNLIEETLKGEETPMKINKPILVGIYGMFCGVENDELEKATKDGFSAQRLNFLFHSLYNLMYYKNCNIYMADEPIALDGDTHEQPVKWNSKIRNTQGNTASNSLVELGSVLSKWVHEII